MSAGAWSAILQWSRIAVNAVVFLVAARYLTLQELGAFATAFAPVRVIQGMQKSGSADFGVLASENPARLTALAFMSFGSGLGLAALVFALSFLMPPQVSSLMQALSVLPLLNGLAFPSEASLRRQFRIRALALRTLATQAIAAGAALWFLSIGLGLWCLASFAIANATLNAILSIALGRIWPTCVPDRLRLATELPMIGHLAVRDLANSSVQPILQFTLGLCLGLPAAGAFQIAARLFALVDAVAISPIRFLALPKLADADSRGDLSEQTLIMLGHTATIAFLVYPGAILVGPGLLAIVVGNLNESAVSQLLPAFCVLGLMNAIAMPLNQALTASGQTRLTLFRALATLGLSFLFAMPGLGYSVQLTTASLPVAAGLVLVFFVPRALQQLKICFARARSVILSPCLCGTMTGLAAILVFGSTPTVTPTELLSMTFAIPTTYFGLMALSRIQTRTVRG